MFEKLIKFIHTVASAGSFKEATHRIREYLDDMSKENFLEIVKNIGTIPENIMHDSTEEKLYSKASDIVLARCFRLLGLASRALDERADSADIIAQSSSGYQYSLVADAKCFRLSRTARNQKDFKVSNLSDWRGAENEYAVLVAPYFQYPQRRSQIYSKALENNVCLISWEHISLLLENNIEETEQFSLESLWNSSQMIARDSRLAFASRQDCFLEKIDQFVAKKAGLSAVDYEKALEKYKSYLIIRGKTEIEYWNRQIDRIRQYSREEAIDELIRAHKLNEKIKVILSYITKLEN